MLPKLITTFIALGIISAGVYDSDIQAQIENYLSLARQNSTAIEMRTIATMLHSHYIIEDNYPADFDKWMNESFITSDDLKSVTEDHWGNNYILEVNEDKFTILSRGQDEELGTDDDLVFKRT